MAPPQSSKTNGELPPPLPTRHLTLLRTVRPNLRHVWSTLAPMRTTHSHYPRLCRLMRRITIAKGPKNAPDYKYVFCLSTSIFIQFERDSDFNDVGSFLYGRRIIREVALVSGSSVRAKNVLLDLLCTSFAFSTRIQHLMPFEIGTDTVFALF